LKTKIVLISEELECISLENVSLKIDFASNSCHASIASSSSYNNIISRASFTSYSTTDNDVHDL